MGDDVESHRVFWVFPLQPPSTTWSKSRHYPPGVAERTSTVLRIPRRRQLPDLQYRLRMNRYHNETLTDDQYRAAVSSVHADLSDLGERPGPK